MTAHSLNFLAVSPQPSPLVRRLAPSLEIEMIKQFSIIIQKRKDESSTSRRAERVVKLLVRLRL